MPTKTTTPPLMIALTTIVLQDAVIKKGDTLPGDDPRVTSRTSFFAPADTPTEQLRQLEADLLQDSATATYQHPAPPPAIRMRARKPFHAEQVTSTHRLVEKGEEFMSDDPLFIDYAAMFERAD